MYPKAHLMLAAARKALGWSQADLAKKCGLRDSKTISRIERALGRPSVALADRIQWVFEKSGVRVSSHMLLHMVTKTGTRPAMRGRARAVATESEGLCS